jgi:tungstate transport system ATP-binding protein
VAETLLTLRDVTVRHGEHVTLQVAFLEVKRGEVLALIGPNGAGKSTLLRVMGLLEGPASGKVFFRNEEATPKNALNLRRRMAHVFQEPLLLNVSVYDNAALGLKLRGLDRGEIDKQVQLWLTRLGIRHLVSRPARTLSGGEARRTSLARAFVLNPELLILDEPFSALDQATREALIDDLQQILRETGITTVLVTHDRSEAFTLGKRVGVLHNGKLLQIGLSLDVFMHPLSEIAAEIVGFENRIPGVAEAAANGIVTVRLRDTAVRAMGDALPGTRVMLCVRAENIGLRRDDEANWLADDLNRLRASVTKILPGMTHDRVILRRGSSVLTAAVRRSQALSLDLREGAEVVACFDPAAVRVVAVLDNS